MPTRIVLLHNGGLHHREVVLLNGGLHTCTASYKDTHMSSRINADFYRKIVYFYTISFNIFLQKYLTATEQENCFMTHALENSLFCNSTAFLLAPCSVFNVQ
jgi:hypothetical protein